MKRKKSGAPKKRKKGWGPGHILRELRISPRKGFNLDRVYPLVAFFDDDGSIRIRWAECPKGKRR
jgi:hypothetical protein